MSTAETSDTKAAVNTLLASLNVQYTATFVPFSQSRNAKEERKSLNWKISLYVNKHANFTTDYMQGVGHIPGYDKQKNKHDRQTLEDFAVEKGKTYRAMTSYGMPTGVKPLPLPEAADVLYCLVMDASAMDYASFEDWAREYGYTEDSRKAERTYKTCIDHGLALTRLIGFANIDKLRTLFQDY